MKLPAIRDAKLPATYEQAKDALQKCSDIDECKTWADKAAAIASYAKQADDKSLQRLAERIRARAVDRCGELYQEIEKAQGTRSDLGSPSARGEAQKMAGMSDRQRKTALRLASIPQDQFDALVESENPPTISELAALGTKKKEPLIDLNGRSEEDFKQATSLLGILKDLLDEFRKLDIPSAIRGCSLKELKRAEEMIDASYGFWTVLEHSIRRAIDETGGTRTRDAGTDQGTARTGGRNRVGVASARDH